MIAFIAALVGATAVADGADVVQLQQLWSGVRDSSEQVVMNLDHGPSSVAADERGGACAPWSHR